MVAELRRDCQPSGVFMEALHDHSVKCSLPPGPCSTRELRPHCLGPTVEIFLGGARPPILPGCYFLPLWPWRVSLLLLTFPSASLVWNSSQLPFTRWHLTAQPPFHCSYDPAACPRLWIASVPFAPCSSFLFYKLGQREACVLGHVYVGYSLHGYCVLCHNWMLGCIHTAFKEDFLLGPINISSWRERAYKVPPFTEELEGVKSC